MMEFIGGIFWLIWLLGIFFIKRNSQRKNQAQRSERTKPVQAKKTPMPAKHDYDPGKESLINRKKERDAMLQRNQRTQKSARLVQDSVRKRNQSSQQSSRQGQKKSIKDFVENVQTVQPNRLATSNRSSEEIDKYELEAMNRLEDSYKDEFPRDHDEIDWENYESDLFEDSEWATDEEILQGVQRLSVDGGHTSTGALITLNASNIKDGIILSEILGKPKSLS